MHLLPVSFSLPLTWCLCALLAIWGLRLWHLAQMAEVRYDISSASRRASHRERRSASWRLDRIIDRQRHAVFQNSESGLIAYDLLRALQRAFVLVPLACVAAKAATDDRIFSVFGVFSGQPATEERMGRALLVILVFAGTIHMFPRFEGWVKKALGKGNAVFLFPVLLVFPLQICGMTIPFALFLVLPLAVCCVWRLPRFKDSLPPESLPLGHAAYIFALALMALLLLAPFYLTSGAFGGLLAVVLLLGVILPLSVAPAFFLALVTADRMVERVVNSGYGRWGMTGCGVQALSFAGLSLVLLGFGLAFALWFFAAVGPAAYRPELRSLTDLSTLAAFASLAVVTLSPLLVVPLTALADTIREHSFAMRKARMLLSAKAVPEAEVVRALVRAEATGWGGTMLAGLAVLYLVGRAVS